MGYRKQLIKEKGPLKKDGDIMNTWCSSFLLPLVGITKFDFGLHFINAYISTEKPYCMYVVCDNVNNVTHIVPDIRISSKPTYISTEINEDEIIYKFNIHSEDYYIYDLFIKGKYSEFPENYKRELIDIYGKEVIREGHSVTEYNVLYPKECQSRLKIDKRKQIAKRLGVDLSIVPEEVLDIPNLEYEAYKSLQELKALNECGGEAVRAESRV